MTERALKTDHPTYYKCYKKHCLTHIKFIPWEFTVEIKFNSYNQKNQNRSAIKLTNWFVCFLDKYFAHTINSMFQALISSYSTSTHALLLSSTQKLHTLTSFSSSGQEDAKTQSEKTTTKTQFVCCIIGWIWNKILSINKQNENIKGN